MDLPIRDQFSGHARDTTAEEGQPSSAGLLCAGEEERERGQREAPVAWDNRSRLRTQLATARVLAGAELTGTPMYRLPVVQQRIDAPQLG